MLVAATVSLTIGIIKEGLAKGWIEGFTIYVAVVIIVSVTAGNDYAKEKQFQKLVALNKEAFCKSLRSGENETKSIYDLVVGEVVEITNGMGVPADCILLTGTDITCDESPLTGEPDHVRKEAVIKESQWEHNPNCFMYAQTLVMSGVGTALVCAVGTET